MSIIQDIALAAAEPVGNLTLEALKFALARGTSFFESKKYKKVYVDSMMIQQSPLITKSHDRNIRSIRVAGFPDNTGDAHFAIWSKDQPDETEKRIFISFNGQRYSVTSMREIFNLVSRKFELEDKAGVCFTITHLRTGKLLRCDSKLAEYNWSKGSNELLVMEYNLLGGGKTTTFADLMPTNMAIELENSIIRNPYMSLDVEDVFDVQAAEYSPEDDVLRNNHFAETVSRRLSEWISSQQCRDFNEKFDAEWTACLVENIIHSYFWFKRTDNYRMWAMLVYKLFTGKSSSLFVIRQWKKLFGADETASEVQASFGDTLKFMRNSFDTIENVENSPILKKFKTLYTQMLIQGFLERFGMQVTEDEYSRLEIRALQAANRGRRGLWMSAFDVVLFLTEKFYEFYETRDISVFTHNTSEYADWHKEVDRIIGLADFIGNLEAHGTTYFTYIADLDDAVEKGEAYLKYTGLRGAVDSTYIAKRLTSLRTIKLTQITRRAAQEERQAPFGVLIAGHSGVAKSTFCKMLYYYFGKLRNLNTDPRYIYRRNVTDQYWSNFDTSKWCIQLDDIAFKLPAKTTQLDETLAELLNIANNVPYVPNQADLKDKGNTPVRCQLLIGTTNAIDLNASEYFYCPLAVQRRLPFIVEVEPKEEFMHTNGHFIDPTKLSGQTAGFPNYWKITVRKITPFMDGARERCRLDVDPHVYEDVNEFLHDYGSSIMTHFRNQQNSLECDGFMSQLEVCSSCLYPRSTCTCAEVQADDIVVPPITQEWVQRERQSAMRNFCEATLDYYTRFFMWYLSLRWHLWALHVLMRFSVFRHITYKVCVMMVPESAQCRLFGILNGIQTTTRRWNALADRTKLIIGVAGALLVGYGLYSKFSSSEKKEEKTEQKKEQFNDVVPQGNKFNTTEEQLVKETSQNVWYTPTVETTRFDLPVASQSLAGKSSTEIRDIFARNVVRLYVRVPLPDGSISVRNVCGVFVAGGYLLTNAHVFGHVDDECELEIISSPVCEGINSNLRIRLRLKEIAFRKEQDLCMIKVTARPPEKSILKFWMDKEFTVTKTCEVRRTTSGVVDVSEVFGVELLPQTEVPSLNITIPVYIGSMNRETQNGDCGSICVAMAPLGTCIIGFHMLGRERRSGSVQILRQTVIDLQKEVDQKEFFPVKVEGGGAPMLSVQDKTVTLGEVSHRSLSRYLPEGSLRMYGTLSLPIPRYISRVGPTLLQEEMKEHFNIEVDHGKPAMRGWEPWRNNLVKMVEPENTFDRTVLLECAESYVEDVISRLPEGWEKELVTLSDKAAVNGLPGVKFIDGMNRNSSMGFPWNSTKRNFLEPDVDECYPEGVTFPPEVWERVKKIEECYAQGRRAYPVFSAHLKDCALPFEKIAKKKTRVFTGQPVDHCIVMRKYLLSFVRLVQKNKFAFEAGPGTVTQSKEWGMIRDYLVAFGEDQLVAGDFGSYDKKMAAALIVIAFQAISKIHEQAGFTDEECQKIMCIGFDIAFSICNFHGDLVEFFGTNPSGHALTVIINSIVNSLYMRYSYYFSNPSREVKSFRSNVNLFTYGDDNAMGVNKATPWFNHTAIQKVLASIGVEYTMADKHSVSCPFIHIDNVSFLKRKWRWDTEIGAWMCPLEMASLHKTLTVWLPSSTIDKESQMVEIIHCVNNELFFHGREEFEKHFSFFKSILNRYPFSELPKSSLLMSYDELVERYQQSTRSIAGVPNLEEEDEDLAVSSLE